MNHWPVRPFEGGRAAIAETGLRRGRRHDAPATRALVPLRLLDGHFPDSGIAAEALARAVNRALETGVPLVDVAYLSVTSGEGF